METMTAPHRSGGTEPGEHGASPPDTAAPVPGSARASIRMWAILIGGALLLAVIAALTLWSRPAPEPEFSGVGQHRDDGRRGEFQDCGPGGGASGAEGETVRAGRSWLAWIPASLEQEMALRKAEVRRRAALAGWRPALDRRDCTIGSRGSAGAGGGGACQGRFQAPQDAL